MKISRNMNWLRCSLLLGAALGLTCVTATAQAPAFHVVQTWHIGGDGGWDYLTTDPGAHRLYIARGNRVQVVDTANGKLIAEMGDMGGVHGVAFDSRGKYGYISDGK